MLTAVFSREEEASDPSLFSFVKINETVVFDSNISVTCRLNQSVGDLQIYQVQLHKNREQVELHFQHIWNPFSDASPYSKYQTTVFMQSPMPNCSVYPSNICNRDSFNKNWVVHPHYLWGESSDIWPFPTLFSVSGGPRLGALLFGLIASVELLNTNVSPANLIQIYTQMMSQRQFFLSKRHSTAGMVSPIIKHVFFSSFERLST